MRADLSFLFYARLIEGGLRVEKCEGFKVIKDTLNLVFHENLNFDYGIVR
jgi:hypothetical protein